MEESTGAEVVPAVVEQVEAKPIVPEPTYSPTYTPTYSPNSEPASPTSEVEKQQEKQQKLKSAIKERHSKESTSKKPTTSSSSRTKSSSDLKHKSSRKNKDEESPELSCIKASEEQYQKLHDPWSSEDEETPEHIRGLRNFVERPKTLEETKKCIRAKKSGTFMQEKTYYKPILLDTEPVNLGTFNIALETQSESMYSISERRKSVTKDKEDYELNKLYGSRSRLKVDVPPKKASLKKSLKPKSPPLIIPSAYAPALKRQYGDKIPTLQDFQKENAVNLPRSKSASKDHRHRNPEPVEKYSTSSKKSTKSKPKREPSTHSLNHHGEDSDKLTESDDDCINYLGGISRKDLTEALDHLLEKQRRNVVMARENTESTHKRRSARQ